MNELQTTLDEIKLDKDTNLKPENLRQGITCLGITGNMQEGIDTSDATATADDILFGKIAYVNGQRIVGTIKDYVKIDWTNNNYEVKNNTLKIKKAYNTIGYEDSNALPEIPVPETLISTINKNKDSIWIEIFEFDKKSKTYRVVFYIPDQGDYLETSCDDFYSVDVIDRKKPWNLNTNRESIKIYAVRNVDGVEKTYKEDSNIEFTEYYYDYTIGQSASELSITDYRQNKAELFTEKYTAILALASDELNKNIAVGNYFEYYDYKKKPTTIDGVAMKYINLNSPYTVSSDWINGTSSFDFATGDVVDNGDQVDQYSSWSKTNPNGTMEYNIKDNSIPLQLKAWIKDGTTGGGIICGTLFDELAGLGSSYPDITIDGYSSYDSQKSLRPQYTIYANSSSGELISSLVFSSYELNATCEEIELTTDMITNINNNTTLKFKLDGKLEYEYSPIM